MTKAQHHFTELYQALKKLEEIQKVIDTHQEKIAKLISPYKIGDVIKVLGPTYQGQKCRVKFIRFAANQHSYGLLVGVAVLYKNGQESARRTSWTALFDPKLEAALKKLQP